MLVHILKLFHNIKRPCEFIIIYLQDEHKFYNILGIFSIILLIFWLTNWNTIPWDKFPKIKHLYSLEYQDRGADLYIIYPSCCFKVSNIPRLILKEFFHHSLPPISRYSKIFPLLWHTDNSGSRCGPFPFVFRTFLLSQSAPSPL